MNATSLRGLFLVIEGPNFAGKSTLIIELAEWLRGLGYEVIVTREPGGTPMGEGLRAVLKNPAMRGGAFATALVFEGARKEHADVVITPGVARGAVVICDRYFHSTDIFQIDLSGALSAAEKKVLRDIHATFPQPDLTVFLIPTDEVIAARRRVDGEVDQFEGNPRELSAYRDYAASYGDTNPALLLEPTEQEEGQSKVGKVTNDTHFLALLGAVPVCGLQCVK
jgi:dTMP kinase